MDTPTFVLEIRRVIDQLTEQKVRVAGVTTDGCLFQRKGLNWQDQSSLQKQAPKYGKIIMVRCVCHLLNNALVWMHAHDEFYCKMISRMREAAIIARKPENRQLFGSLCPTFIATRWMYDFPILSWITENWDSMQLILPERFLSDDLFAILPLAIGNECASIPKIVSVSFSPIKPIDRLGPNGRPRYRLTSFTIPINQK
jgi:hypothetical protein